MLKNSLKNYFISFRHFFTPLGTMFLGMMLGFSVLIPGAIGALNGLIENIKLLADGVNLDFAVLWEEIRGNITALDWDDPFGVIQTMLSGEWITKVLNESLSVILGEDFNVFAEHIVNIINTFVVQIVACVFIFIAFFIIGFIAGFMLTKFFIRRNIAKRSLWKWILTGIINSFLTVGCLILCGVLYSMWQPSVFFSSLIMLVLSCIVALTEAYLVYGYKKVKFSAVLNVGNTGLYLLSNFLIFLISLVFMVIAVAINSLMGFFVGLAILEIALCVMDMNAVSFVQGLIGEQSVPPAQDVGKAA